MAPRAGRDALAAAVAEFFVDLVMGLFSSCLAVFFSFPLTFCPLDPSPLERGRVAS
jgi:hypothetical protein